ncbi:MAG: DNA replication/repair protein RecF, partial [Eggerthellaceae bacterium]|nr:DNA replication/repair protein RecF [Eggerthellaceae bacterium]
NKEYLASMNEVIAKVGAQYYVHRSVLCSKIKPYLEKYYSQISNGSERVELCYLPSWGTVEDSANREHIQRLLQDSLDQREEEERARKKSVVGPHTDDIQFILDGENALHFASQGQQRSIVLAYKMAEASLIQEILGQKPLLLLDDVMSELDEHRRSCFVDFIGGKTQTFITTTNLSYFDDSLLKDAEVIKLPIEDCCP